MRIEVPKKVQEIISVLQGHGYDAYAVGGCVRDSLLGVLPADWDITTSARPDQVKELFPKTLDTGIAHGTVTVMLGKEGFEVTTYRIDGEYEDGRHPKEVIFTGELLEDLRRRDFTINAMAYNSREGLIDAFGGTEDLQAGIIRCVGNPEERFQEDALRILRAFRFAGQLGFSIEKTTLQAAARLAGNLEKISAERIAAELGKLLVSKNPGVLRTAYEAGVTAVILPEFDRMMETEQNTPHHCYSVGEHTLKTLEYIPADKVLRYTMLLHDMGKPVVKVTDQNGRDHFKGHETESEKLTGQIMKRLKMDNDTIGKVKKLVRWHDSRQQPEPGIVRRAVNKVGKDMYPLLLQVQYADTMAKSMYKREEKLDRIYKVQEIYEEILRKGQCVSLRDLAVNGKDLIQTGMKPGKEIGGMLEFLLEEVLEEPSCNTKEYLLKRAEEKSRQDS
ncbi:MAG: CCA tRNA nucleotidyltransferase [Blautia sp.]